MAQGIPILKDAPYNVLTVPNYVRSLVVTTKPAQVIAAYTAPPGVEAWTVYRPSAEGAPAHPYDGWRVVTPLSEDAETTVAVTLTDHIVNDTEYVVRVFIRGRLGFQTRVGGAVATATPRAGLQLSNIPEGGFISLNENGTPVLFYVEKHGYEPDLNGPGRSLVVRKDCHSKRQWDATANTTEYSNCDLDIWFNADYKALLDGKVQAVLSSTMFYYSSGSTSTTVTTLGRAIFALSVTELGFAMKWANIEGSALPIASTLKVAYLNGVATEQWTRTPYITTGSARYVFKANTDGTATAGGCTYSTGIRPAFTLPSDMLFSLTPNPDGSYSPIL